MHRRFRLAALIRTPSRTSTPRHTFFLQVVHYYIDLIFTHRYRPLSSFQNPPPQKKKAKNGTGQPPPLPHTPPPPACRELMLLHPRNSLSSTHKIADGGTQIWPSRPRRLVSARDLVCSVAFILSHFRDPQRSTSGHPKNSSLRLCHVWFLRLFPHHPRLHRATLSTAISTEGRTTISSGGFSLNHAHLVFVGSINDCLSLNATPTRATNNACFRMLKALPYGGLVIIQLGRRHSNLNASLKASVEASIWLSAVILAVVLGVVRQ